MPETKWTLWSDAETTRVYGDVARLHTRLAPYFMTLAHEAHDTGLPAMRHPFLIAPADPETFAIEDSFFLGPALYASPVVRRGVTVKWTYLPLKGTRYVDLDDHQVYGGGSTWMIPAPLDKLPLLLVEAQILPMLDPSIETLASSTSTSVITPDKVADRLDVLVSLAVGDHATLTLDDGTVLSAERDSAQVTMTSSLASTSSTAVAGCASCIARSHVGDVDRWQINSPLAPTTEVRTGDLILRSMGTSPRRIRWDVQRLP
jgi:alpha-glucosidase (family GH31 glycosyl hydrolase)